MSYGVKLAVWGDYALFTRPELKVERVSYDCLTPSAARGILEAIFWHPGLKWCIDRIKVCKPIKYANISKSPHLLMRHNRCIIRGAPQIENKSKQGELQDPVGSH